MDQDTVTEHARRWFDLLADLAGILPDDLLREARCWLAAGRTEDLARATVYALLTQGVGITAEEAGLIRETLIGLDLDPDVLDRTVEVVAHPVPPFVFVDGADAAGRPLPVPRGEAELVALLAAGGAACGLWRTWRVSLSGSPWPPPRVVWVVEADDTADRIVLARDATVALAGGGDPDPQVEVHHTGDDLPVYQRMARVGATLRWAREPEREIRLARVFDTVVDRVGRFAEDHPRLGERDGERRVRVLDYLESGLSLLSTTAQVDDVLDPSRRDAVPLSFRTDGTWIWSETIIYYLREHRLAPDPELLEHLDAIGFVAPPVDGAVLDRAAAALMRVGTAG